MTIGDFTEFSFPPNAVQVGNPLFVGVGNASDLLIVTAITICNTGASVATVQGQVSLTGDATTAAKRFFEGDILPGDTIVLDTYLVLDGTVLEGLKFFETVGPSFIPISVSGLLRQVA